MGMYDTITVHPKWTGIEEGVGYQTKSLNCTLSHYDIDEDGNFFLVTHASIFEPYSIFNPFNITREIIFYTDEAKDCDWVEFTAKIDNGVVTEVNKRD